MSEREKWGESPPFIDIRTITRIRSGNIAWHYCFLREILNSRLTGWGWYRNCVLTIVFTTPAINAPNNNDTTLPLNTVLSTRSYYYSSLRPHWGTVRIFRITSKLSKKLTDWAFSLPSVPYPFERKTDRETFIKYGYHTAKILDWRCCRKRPVSRDSTHKYVSLLVDMTDFIEALCTMQPEHFQNRPWSIRTTFQFIYALWSLDHLVFLLKSRIVAASRIIKSSISGPSFQLHTAGGEKYVESLKNHCSWRFSAVVKWCYFE